METVDPLEEGETTIESILAAVTEGFSFMNTSMVGAV
jgi:hypothetical protein